MRLTDATVLGALPKLSSLDIQNCSSIASLQPLVDSQYIGAGDTLVAYALDCEKHTTALQALYDKGVVLENSCSVGPQ